MSILVIAEHNNQSLKPSTLNTLTAASQCGDEISVLVAGSDCAAVVEQLQGHAHINEIIHVDHPVFSHPLAEVFAPIIQRCAEGKTHVLAPATTFGKNIMPRVAAMLDAGQVSDISKVIDANTFERLIYAGNAIATVKNSDECKVITVRPTAFEVAEKVNASVEVKKLDINENNELSEFISVEVHASERPELSSASTVISGGRGLKDEATFKRLEAIADRMGAAVGASRAAVDAGLAPNDFQVGQTGQIVAPKLYIAIGISGAIQHLAGMKDSKIIVAINKDPDAPIFQVADYGLVADLNEVLPKWEALLDQLGL